jgi:hypothetical protein
MGSRVKIVRRGLRRLYARWRLHRMEWNGMQAPLTPPPGYEKYTEFSDALPGLQGVQPIQSYAHFREVLGKAWKLYLHHYWPDPDIIAAEEAAAKERDSALAGHARNIARERAKLVRSTRKVVANARENLPSSAGVLTDRLAVLHEALEEFMVGYKEASSGEVDILGNIKYSPDIVRPDNAPVVYRVEQQPADLTDK